jgi:flagellar protein FlgJ
MRETSDSLPFFFSPNCHWQLSPWKDDVKIQNGISLKPLSPEEAATKRDSELREVSKMYEAHFLNEMVKAMRKTVDDSDGLIKKNMAEKIFAEQLDNQYVEGWSNKGGVGIADMIYNQVKDKYFDTTKKDFSHPHKMLPISPQKELHEIQTDSIQMKMIPPSTGAKLEYRFEVPDSSGGSPFDALAPLPGKVAERVKLGDGWNLVKLDHGQGLTSELTFPGSLQAIDTGLDLPAGQKLGTLDPGRPVLAWKLDWPSDGSPV